MSNNNQRRFADKPSNKMSCSAGSNANLSQYTPTAPEYDPAGYTAEPKTKKKHKITRPTMQIKKAIHKIEVNNLLEGVYS